MKGRRGSAAQPRPPLRLKFGDRRDQLLAIGLGMLMKEPIHQLSLDAVARKANISRSLLFHYFPTKSDYFDAVLDVATQRVLDNTAPPEDADPDAALRFIVGALFETIDRRREFYLAFVFGQGALTLGGDRVASLRTDLGDRVLAALGLSEDAAASTMVHAWIAYIEDLALQWARVPEAERDDTFAGRVDHCVAALRSLIAL
jgi:AcrR family transcriptional regulator